MKVFIVFLSLRKGRGGRIAPSIVSETLSAAQGALRFLVDFGVTAGEGISTLRAHRRHLCCLGFLFSADFGIARIGGTAGEHERATASMARCRCPPESWWG